MSPTLALYNMAQAWQHGSGCHNDCNIGAVEWCKHLFCLLGVGMV